MSHEEERNTRVLVRSAMSIYEGAKRRVIVDCELSEEFEVKVGIHQGSVLSPFCGRCEPAVTERIKCSCTQFRKDSER